MDIVILEIEDKTLNYILNLPEVFSKAKSRNFLNQLGEILR